MDRRTVVSASTLTVLSLILVLAAVWGWNALFPDPTDDGPANPAFVAPTCTPTTVEGRRIRTRDITVSVYNAGNRSGQAGRVLTALESRGFRAGALGNAPEGTEVARAQVWAASEEDPAAQLLARHLGRRTPIVVRDGIGPGLTVMVGNNWNQLARAPRAIKVEPDEETCA